jgi:hypothetical protein
MAENPLILEARLLVVLQAIVAVPNGYAFFQAILHYWLTGLDPFGDHSLGHYVVDRYA